MKTFLYLFLFLPNLMFAQITYRIKGKFEENIYPEKVFIKYVFQGRNRVDSTLSTNGQFEFKGILPLVTPATLYFENRNNNKKEIYNFYIDHNQINIKVNQTLNKIIVSGGNTNKDKQQLDQHLEPLQNALTQTLNQFKIISKNSPNDKESKFWIDKYNSLRDSLKTEGLDFVKKHTNSYVTLEYLNHNLRDVNPYVAQEILEDLAPDLKKYPLYYSLFEKNDKRILVSVGQYAPPFSVRKIDGTNVSLEQFKGQYVLVDFWASWCGPCREQNPLLLQIFKKFKGEHFQILAISLDTENQKESWLNAIKKDKTDEWIHASDLKGWRSEVLKLYGVEAIPQNFLINPEGKIIAVNIKANTLLEKLQELLK